MLAAGVRSVCRWCSVRCRARLVLLVVASKTCRLLTTRKLSAPFYHISVSLSLLPRSLPVHSLPMSCLHLVAIGCAGNPSPLAILLLTSKGRRCSLLELRTPSVLDRQTA